MQPGLRDELYGLGSGGLALELILMAHAPHLSGVQRGVHGGVSDGMHGHLRPPDGRRFKVQGSKFRGSMV